MSIRSARSWSLQEWRTPLHADPLLWTARILLASSLLAAAIHYAAATIHWSLALDAPVMHYVNFLMRHGMRPYVDITDNNMPAAYYTEGLAMRVFGGGDLAWRMYDYFLLTSMTVGLILIAKQRDWLAGLFAGCMFIALHGPDGPGFTVEREQVVSVLLVFGYVTSFRAVCHKRPWWMLLFGVTNAVACSIKPTFFPLSAGLLLLVAIVLRRQRVPAAGYVWWASAGFSTVLIFDLVFLLHYDALRPFWFVVRHVLPAYSTMGRASLLHLLVTFDHKLLLLVAATLPLAFANWKRNGAWDWEKWAVALGVVFAFFSYIVQGKHFPHHRYPILIFTLLLCGWEIVEAMRSTGWPRNLALACCFFVIAWMLPRKMQALHLVRPQSPFTVQLQSDLVALGGAGSLQDEVQCFDLVYGCLNALYHLDIVENTGFTGELLLFGQPRNTATAYYRQRYWELAQKRPASVIVVSNEWFERSNSFRKLDRWPEFETYIEANYTLAVERRFPMLGGVMLSPQDSNFDERDAYRIYLRKGSAEAAMASSLTR